MSEQKQVYTVQANGFTAICDAILHSNKQILCMSLIGTQVACKSIAATIYSTVNSPIFLSEGYAEELLTMQTPYYANPRLRGTYHSAPFVPIKGNRAYHTIIYTDLMRLDYTTRSDYIIAVKTDSNIEETTTRDQLVDMNYRYWNERYAIPCLPHWKYWLFDNAMYEKWLEPCEGTNMVGLYANYDPEELKLLITEAIQNNKLTKPVNPDQMELVK